MATGYSVRHKGGTKAAWKLSNPVIPARELVIETDTKKLKVGDGTKRYEELDYLNGGAISGVGFSYVPGGGTTAENGAALAAEINRAGAGTAQHTIFVDDAIYEFPQLTTIKGNIRIKTMSGNRGATLRYGSTFDHPFLTVKKGCAFDGIIVKATLVGEYNVHTGDISEAEGILFENCMFVKSTENQSGQSINDSIFRNCEIDLKWDLGSIVGGVRRCDFQDCECVFKETIVQSCTFKNSRLKCTVCHFAGNSCFDSGISLDRCRYINNETPDLVSRPSNFHNCFISGVINIEDDLTFVFCYSCYFDYIGYEEQKCTRYGCFIKNVEDDNDTYLPTPDVFSDN